LTTLAKTGACTGAFDGTGAFGGTGAYFTIGAVGFYDIDY